MSQSTGPKSEQVERLVAGATSAYQGRRLAEAAGLCQQALAIQPDCLPAMQMGGAIALLTGDRLRAVELLERTVAAAPLIAEHRLNLGQAYRVGGDFKRAEETFREAVRLAPGNPEGHYLLGGALFAAGRWAEAAEAHQQALQVRPAFPEAHMGLGLALAKQGNLEQAVACYRRALELNPNYSLAWQNLGAAMAAQGNLDGAIECFQKAIGARADEKAFFDLGMALKLRGDVAGAIACFKRATTIRLSFDEAYGELADCCKRLLQNNPENYDAHYDLANVLHRRGSPDEELYHLNEALRISSSPDLRVQQAFVLPMIYESTEHLARWRQRILGQVAELVRDGVRVDVSELQVVPPFELAYQGFNERDVQRDIATLFAAPAIAPPAPGRSAGETDKRPRVGIISSYLKQHTIGHLNRGLIANLSRRDIHTTVLAIEPGDDTTAEAIKQSAERYVQLPARLPEARKIIADLGLDVMLYTDIGMDVMTYTLALSRLAPVQCVTWGHPLTTGLPTMDYFISSELLETGPEAQEHYTEKLVQLTNLAVYYHRPPAPVGGRAEGTWGLPQDRHWYTCPQSLFKLHPDFDAVMGEILRRDERGVIVLLRGFHKEWEGLLRQRWAKTMPDVAERVVFVSRLERPQFLGLCAASEAILDPLHFGGGNTSYEAFSVGAPIVTLPSAFLRGRITLALYKQMGVMDCVVNSAEDYVERAVKLGTDEAYRDAIRSKISAASGVLFENAAGVRELEEFFKTAVRK